jgi:hypothetical protein
METWTSWAARGGTVLVSCVLTLEEDGHHALFGVVFEDCSTECQEENAMLVWSSKQVDIGRNLPVGGL